MYVYTTYRYTFTILANIIVFGCFWGLLEKFNHTVDATALGSDDKEIFWVQGNHVFILPHVAHPVPVFFQHFIQYSVLLPSHEIGRLAGGIGLSLRLGHCLHNA